MKCVQKKWFSTNDTSFLRITNNSEENQIHEISILRRKMSLHSIILYDITTKTLSNVFSKIIMSRNYFLLICL